MTTERARHRPQWIDATLLLCIALIVWGLIALGNWQMRRLIWKTDLIEQVEARAYQSAIPLPTASKALPYQRVTAAGRFDYGKAARVKAVTELGPGFWMMVPLETDGATVWVNRGFVPTGVNELFRPRGSVRLEGLLRETEADGTLLEENDPAAGRWVSRDVAALSKVADVPDALPYFIDADPMGAPGGWPRGGLSQLSFRNTHLIYALTWYSMAVLLAAAVGWIVVTRFRRRRAV